MHIRTLPLLFTLLAAIPAFAGQMPTTEMDNLAGKTMHFPVDFKGKPMLVILAFAHEQREEAVRVMALLQKAQETNAALSWYELPIIDAPLVAHMFIRNGMIDGTDPVMHPHIVPQFVDEDEWHAGTGINTKEPLLAKVDSEGKILKTTPLSAVTGVADIIRF